MAEHLVHETLLSVTVRVLRRVELVHERRLGLLADARTVRSCGRVSTLDAVTVTNGTST